MVRAVRAARQRQTSSVEIQFGGEAFYRRGNRAIGRRRLKKNERSDGKTFGSARSCDSTDATARRSMFTEAPTRASGFAK